MNLNIGGGKFNHPGWVNFDGRQGFSLTKETVFPLETAEIVYSSHCFEHLDDETVSQMLREARRLTGRLVLKIPDFEQVLERLKAKDSAYFDQWGLKSVVHTWERDTLEARASMIFCGWWNKAYGDEWGNRNPNAQGAYHGPASYTLPTGSPHEIAAKLKSLVPKDGQLNHQNAWSLKELVDLVEGHGFSVTSTDKEEVCSLPIPTIQDMKGISVYLSCG
jgi:predicted SAM-dependent methyltransferase